MILAVAGPLSCLAAAGSTGDAFKCCDQFRCKPGQQRSSCATKSYSGDRVETIKEVHAFMVESLALASEFIDSVVTNGSDAASLFAGEAIRHPPPDYRTAPVNLLL
jgi:hypothetical protein